MKRIGLFIGIVAAICCLSLAVSGCTKKTVSKDESLSTAEKQAAAARAEAAAREEAARRLAAEGEAQKKEDARQLALRKDAATVEAGTAEKTRGSFEDIHFAYDKATIEPEAREILKRLAGQLSRGKGFRLVVEGHCDDRGTVEYNMALGQRRADAAMKYLVDLGVDPESIRTVSYGKERPLDPGQNEEAWAKNRRAHFLVTQTQ